MSCWKSLVGDELQSKNGKVKTESLDSSEGDVLGLYFSAHWCPPCRSFTPKLAQFYTDFNSKGGNKFHIVFVSADRSQKDFDGYFGEMPWHALPFDKDDINEELTGKCKVQGIPKLVLFHSTGKEIEMKSDARTMVMTDPKGDGFPWAK